MEWIKKYIKFKKDIPQKSNLGKKDFVMDYEAMINWYNY